MARRARPLQTPGAPAPRHRAGFRRRQIGDAGLARGRAINPMKRFASTLRIGRVRFEILLCRRVLSHVGIDHAWVCVVELPCGAHRITADGLIHSRKGRSSTDTRYRPGEEVPDFLIAWWDRTRSTRRHLVAGSWHGAVKLALDDPIKSDEHTNHSRRRRSDGCRIHRNTVSGMAGPGADPPRAIAATEQQH